MTRPDPTNAISRTITTSILDWRGILIRVTLERQRYADHLQVETLEPQRAPLPITETGYRSSFLPKGSIPTSEDPAAHVEAWLDQTAKARGWSHLEMRVRQYALL